MIRNIPNKSESLNNRDWLKVRDALLIAVLALERCGDRKTLEQIEALLEGRARVERQS
jgi:hypothetical protein